MKLLHELIGEYALSSPDKLALIDDAGEMSYGELMAKSASAARMLDSFGLKPGDAAAVYVTYSKEILLGTVSVIRAGGVFIPMDDAYPEERLQYILKDSGAKAILTVRELWKRKKLDFPEDNVIFLDELSSEDAAYGSCDTLTEDSPAMLLYTSGTTGNPKGVLHNHSMLVHIADWMNTCEGAAMKSDTRSGVMSSFSFVGSQMYLLGPLVQGGTVCIAPEVARKDLATLDQFIRERNITHIFLPAGLAVILAEDYDISGRCVFAAGEKLRNFRPLNPDTFLINSYGSTELSGVMAKKIHGDEEVISVGKPWDNVRVKLVDEAMKETAPGEAGELLVTSSFMSRQYYRLPEQSADKWIELDGTVWFRTGDRATHTPEGDYVILGRTDNMVKLRGFRIETGEVEAQVARAAARLGREDVGEVVVLVKTVSGTEHLCCYYEAHDEVDHEEITEEISKYLAEYMIPDIWVRMDAFPRNANGKIMRKELPQPSSRHRTSGVLDSELISRIVMTAADVLMPEGFIGPDDRFTDLGGTSLIAMKYAAELRQQGIRISGAQVVQLNVLRKIAEAAEVSYEQFWTQEEYSGVIRDFASRGEHILKVQPLTPSQDEMLFMHILYPDRADFKTIWFLQLDSRVSEAHLRKALDTVAEEIPTLRESIVFRDVSVVQQVITDRRIPLEMLEFETFGSSEMSSFRRKISEVSVDLQHDSLVKVYCIHSPERDFLCVAEYSISVDENLFRRFVARIMGILKEDYPDDASIRDWHEVITMGLELDDEQPETEQKQIALPVNDDEKKDIYVYSENSNPKLVFVHTGNTGSDAYYQLADRFRDRVSFAVIEPFNLYHMDEAVYGIKNIATNYIRILKSWQPEGPYLLGGWCYGGIIAHEMACQLEQAGEEVKHLFMLDSHALDSRQLRDMSRGMFSQIDRHYFETCPLFAELRENGMLDAMVSNAVHVAEDIGNHTPSMFHGDVTYFKPEQIPAGVTGDNGKYWEKMMEFDAGNFENYCIREKLRIIKTPHEHDLMMDEPSLDIIVPEMLKDIQSSRG